MEQLFLVRHGQTLQNAQGRIVSAGDPSLDETGRRQAIEVAEQLSSVSIDLAVSSPYLRCTSTLDEIVSRQRTQPRTRVDNRLRELGMGVIEGLSPGEISAQGLDSLFRQWRQGVPPAYPDGAETFEAAGERLLAVLADAHVEDVSTVLIVGHSHALRILIAVGILGVGPDVHRRLFLDHATVTTVFFESGVPRLGTVNGTVGRANRKSDR